MPRALVFDAYGTLFDVLSVQARCESCWPGQGAALARLWRAKQLEYTWQRSLMQRYVPFSRVTQDALEYGCGLLGLKLEEENLRLLMDEYLRLAVYPDVPQALRQFKPRKLAILTNGSPDMIGPLVKNSGMEKTFDAVLSVDELKIYKPAPQVYRLAAERLGVAAADIGFVSSNGWDAAGARSFGFTVYWINRLDAPVERLGFAPDAVLKGLGELPRIIAG